MNYGSQTVNNLQMQCDWVQRGDDVLLTLQRSNIKKTFKRVKALTNLYNRQWITSNAWYFCNNITGVLYLPAVLNVKSNQIKSNHFYCHSTCALVSEIIESVLQRVQNQFTYRQYILTDLSRRQCAEYTYIYSILRHTYNYQYTLCTVCTHFTLCTHIHTIVCKTYIAFIKNVH